MYDIYIYYFLDFPHALGYHPAPQWMWGWSHRGGVVCMARGMCTFRDVLCKQFGAMCDIKS